MDHCTGAEHRDLAAENAALQEELSVTRDTLEGMLEQYAASLEGEDDDSATKVLSDELADQLGSNAAESSEESQGTPDDGVNEGPENADYEPDIELAANG